MKASSYRDYPWSMYFSTIAFISVGSISWKNGSLPEDVIMHIVLAFIAMYILTEFCIHLFDKYEIWALLDNPSQIKEKDFELQLVHNDTFEKSTESKDAESKGLDYTGQVEPSLSLGLPDNEARMELKQRMGLQ